MTNCLITKIGRVIECNGGIPHNIICKRKFGYDLAAFLSKRNGGCRVKIGLNPEIIAIEYYRKLSAIQAQIIHKILHDNDYYTIVTEKQTLQSKFRPLRNIVL